MRVKLHVWRQENRADRGKMASYDLDGLSPDMSFLEMMDQLNEKLIAELKALNEELKVPTPEEFGIDRAHFMGLLDTMAELASEGMTMVCVTHEMGFARQVADRVIFMDQGAVVESAPPQEFFDAPKEERTRRFLSQILH